MKNILISSIAVAAVSASAATVDFSYAPAGAPLVGYGFGKVESYDVAIRINDPGLAGTKIAGLKVPITTDEAITDISGWLSTSLKLDNNQPVADIAKVEATVTDGVISVTFPEPYTITEGGVYAGYSFKVGAVDTDAQKYPVVVADCSETNGLYLHSSRTYRKWTSLASSTGTVSALTIVLDGDFKPDMVSVTLGDVYGVKGQPTPVAVTLTNSGSSSVSNFTYTYTLSPSGVSGQGITELETAIPAQLGQKGNAWISVDCPDTYEPQTLSVTVTEINGNPNNSVASTGEAILTPLDFIPQATPLMEEYTGLWCGWCPRGFIALEEMGRRYPERFVGVSYHGDDIMQSTRSFPNEVGGYPGAVLNRSLDLDPYYGSSSGTDMGIAANWEALTEVFAPGEVVVTLNWTDDTHTALKAVADARFVFDYKDADFRISYIVVADGLTCREGDSPANWIQTNYYDGSDMQGYGWEVFTESTSRVAGLVFNDVVVYAGDFLGEKGSVPASITPGVKYSDEFTVSLSDIVNINGDNILNDPSKLRVVAVLMDASTGKFINCGRSNYPDASGVGTNLAEDVRVVGVMYHDLSGHLLRTPASEGVTIRTEILSDGSTRTCKQLR
ncbi:MAG: hypothetical protein K2O24_01845 [Muribaculaceae bacterium]|nr:hypothetical protein [Muribaculaceae bacterium]